MGIKNIVKASALKTLAVAYRAELDDFVKESVQKAANDRAVYVRRASTLAIFKVKYCLIRFSKIHSARRRIRRSLTRFCSRIWETS